MSSRRDRERELTSQILELVSELARLRETERPPFEPGKTLIGYAGRVYGETEMRNLAESALEFWLTAGRWHRKLERELARWYGVPRAHLVNSGSSANLLAIAALMSPKLGDRRLRPGDEVVTVATGFPTTVSPIVQLGAVPVFVDVSLPSYNIDIERLQEALSSRTRAVVLAHTLGNPFDLGAVRSFCDERGLWLVEDNCDAAGSLYAGRKTGTFGDLATLSFYPPHHMTTGEGGAVLCGSEELGKIVESLRDWGRDCWCPSGVDNTCGKRFGWRLGDLPEAYDHKYIYSHLGFNLKMTDLQASVGCAQLERLDDFCRARRGNWSFFRSELSGLEEHFVLPEPTPSSEPSWFGFALTVRADSPMTRGAVVRELEARRIQTRMLFGGNLVRQPAFDYLRPDKDYRVVGELRRSDEVMRRTFWIGVYPGLTETQRSYVAESLRRAVETCLNG